MELQGAAYFVFLGCVVCAHALIQPRWRVALLLAASCSFYAASSVGYLLMFLLLCAVNYAVAATLCRTDDGGARSVLFAAVILLDLFVLATFKYALSTLDSLLRNAAWHSGVAIKWAVPLGISYFTFQMVGALTDAYRRDWRGEGGLGGFLLFGVFFPQITSGPIPRVGRLLPQFSAAVPTAQERMLGIRLIAYGLFKKYVVANRLGEYVNQIFAVPGVTSTVHYSTVPTLIGCIYNVLNLYADFSSYVDIAIGSALLLGIRLDPNFDRPFTSTSVSEFWRRWHMTLSFWLRDYLYMPLVIRIRGLGMTGLIAALIITFAICGIWHDATWPYLVFGVAQGLAMSLELLTRRWRAKWLKGAPGSLVAGAGWVYTMTFFVLSEIFFRASSMSNAGMIFEQVFELQTFSSFAELFAYKGPFDFALNVLAVGIWFAIARLARHESRLSTPLFVLACGLLIVFLGRLGSGQFIYAGF